VDSEQGRQARRRCFLGTERPSVPHRGFRYSARYRPAYATLDAGPREKRFECPGNDGRAFTPVLAKHSKSLNLLDSISVGVDRMQRNFGPMQKQVESWQAMELSNVAAKMIVDEAFIESGLEVPKTLGSARA
jgi:hypothetical protein